MRFSNLPVTEAFGGVDILAAVYVDIEQHTEAHGPATADKKTLQPKFC